MSGVAADEKHATLRPRAIAAFVDLSLTLLPTMLIAIVVFGNVLHLGGGAGHGFGSGIGIAALALGLLTAAQCLLIGFTGQSYGKLALRLRIVRAADGGKASFTQAAIIRTLLFGALWIGIPVVFPLLDVGVGLIRHDGRCLHDLVAGTKVVPA